MVTVPSEFESMAENRSDTGLEPDVPVADTDELVDEESSLSVVVSEVED